MWKKIMTGLITGCIVLSISAGAIYASPGGNGKQAASGNCFGNEECLQQSTGNCNPQEGGNQCNQSCLQNQEQKSGCLGERKQERIRDCWSERLKVRFSDPLSFFSRFSRIF